jgi:hypothetical protein
LAFQRSAETITIQAKSRLTNPPATAFSNAMLPAAGPDAFCGMKDTISPLRVARAAHHARFVGANRVLSQKQRKAGPAELFQPKKRDRKPNHEQSYQENNN